MGRAGGLIIGRRGAACLGSSPRRRRRAPARSEPSESNQTSPGGHISSAPGRSGRPAPPPPCHLCRPLPALSYVQLQPPSSYRLQELSSPAFRSHFLTFCPTNQDLAAPDTLRSSSVGCVSCPLPPQNYQLLILPNPYPSITSVVLRCNVSPPSTIVSLTNASAS